jgi:hypothetical protein
MWKILMCRNIRTLFNFAPPATEEEIRASALQFVQQAVDDVTEAARRLLVSLKSEAQPRDRRIEAAKARARSQKRFSKSWPTPGGA